MSDSTAELDRRHVWHPFTQQQHWCGEEVLVIDRAEGTDLIDDAGNRYIDGVGSLWCNVHGHRHPHIDAAVREQLDRVAHSTMLGLTHEPGARLAAKLSEIAPPGLNRAFYSDSGSTAVEIALKMAFQYWQQRGGQHRRRTSFVSLREGYHGDTIGAVSVGGIDLFHSAFGPLLFKSHQVTAGDVAELERTVELHCEEIAAVIVEPLVQGAAGMLVQPPGYLREVRRICDEHGIFLICDEVATGFGRTGTMFACEQERVVPDFLCLGKGLTGGYLPLAATLTSERVYEGFLGQAQDGRTFFHGHTFTGNPLACAAAIACLEVFESEHTLLRLQPKIRLLHELLGHIQRMPEVAEVRGRGFMVGIDLKSPTTQAGFGRRLPQRRPVHDPALRLGHRVTLEARARGAIIRPLGDTIVLMPPLSISKANLVHLATIAYASISAAWEHAYGQPPAEVEPLAFDADIAAEIAEAA